MAYDIFDISDGLICARVSDFLRVSDQEALQAAAAERIGKGRDVRLLVVLENFQGWERSEAWGDVGFLVEHADDVAKMAIVGEERWKDDVFLFLGKGLRKTEIEFFSPSAVREAEAWVRT